QHLFTAARDIAICQKTADAVVARRRKHRIVNIYIGRERSRKIGGKRDAEQSALSRRFRVDGEKGIGEQYTIFNDAQFAVLLRYKDATIRGNFKRSRIAKTRDNAGFNETGGQRCRVG